MTPGQRLACCGLAAVLLLVLGAGGGAWLAACHYRPLLDAANTNLVSAQLARNSLEALAGEQGRKLRELVQAGGLRERTAAQALAKATQEAQPDYAAANQLLRGRIGGDPAQAAAAIIDQELGL